MKLSVEIERKTQPLEIERDGERWRFRLGDGASREALVRAAEPQVYSILVDGVVYDAHVESAGDGVVVVVISGRRFEIAVRDPRRWSKKSGAAGAEGRQHVTSSMPGKVVRVLVSTGDIVQAGQGLLVVEAMKMQNEMKALKSGRVVSIAAQAGATVSAGEILATIE